MKRPGAHLRGTPEGASPIDLVTSPPPVQQRADMGSWSLVRATQLHEVRHAIKTLVRDEVDAPSVNGLPLLAAVEERLSLVFSELGTNALRYGRSPVQATLSRGDREWLVVVADADTEGRPHPRTPSPEQEGGRGLHLVAAMSEQFGWYSEGETKFVWAVITDAAPAELMQTLQQHRTP